MGRLGHQFSISPLHTYLAEEPGKCCGRRNRNVEGGNDVDLDKINYTLVPNTSTFTFYLFINLYALNPFRSLCLERFIIFVPFIRKKVTVFELKQCLRLHIFS
jgi:hypothetical protein